MIKTNKHGQVLGRKGAESRARLIEAARGLLETLPADKLTASAIARAAGLASQTFYLYLQDVDEALLQLSGEAAQDIQEIMAEVERPWDPTRLADHAGQFVDAYYRYWDRNRAVLTTRNFRAESGIEAFIVRRNDDTMPIIHSLRDRIQDSHGAEGIAPRDALARAIIAVTTIERMASRYPVLEGPPSVFNVDDIKRAEAHALMSMFAPQPS
jgi:AcrR family transcriptional regulator